MKRRELITFFGGAAALWPLQGLAQQPARTPRIGLLSTANPTGFSAHIEALRQGLRDNGYTEGKNILIEYRWAEGKVERLPELAADLVRLNVDVFITHGVLPSRAAKQATSTIPIVVAFTGDAVAMGLVTSLARPEANLTGSSFLLPQINAKRVELLKEALPRLTHITALSNPNNPAARHHIPAMEKTASLLKVKLQTVNVERPNEFDSAFDAMAKSRTEALIVTQDGDFSASFRAIADFASKHRIASAGPPEYAQAGGLIGYGASTLELFRRSAYFVSRIVQGAKPGDLPMEQPTRFDLAVNAKAAKALGISIPQSILLRADKVLE